MVHTIAAQQKIILPYSKKVVYMEIPGNQLCQGSGAKVFEIAEVIQLRAERKKFREGTGIAIPHVYDERMRYVMLRDMNGSACHKNQIYRLISKK